jgi:hypothetical protein
MEETCRSCFAENETKDQETALACLLTDKNNDVEVVMC